MVSADAVNSLVRAIESLVERLDALIESQYEECLEEE